MLNRLYMQNVQSVREADLNLSKYKVVGIVGEIDYEARHSNGAGKSTIGEGILLAWYGKIEDRDIFSYIKDDSNELKIILEWDTDTGGVKKKFKVVRTAVLKPRTHNRELFIDGSEEPYGGGKDATDDYIQDILGQSCSTLTVINFFRQRKDDAFTSLRPAKRKEYMKAAIGMNLYDDALKIANAKINTYTKEMEAYETKKSTYRTEIETLSAIDFEKSMEEAKTNLESCETVIKQTKEEEKKYTEYLTQIQGQQQAYQAVVDKASMAKTRMDNIASSIRGLKDESISLRNKLIDVENAETELSKLQDIVFDQVAYNTVVKTISELTERKGKVEGLISAYDTIAKEVQSLSDNCPTCHRRISGTEKDTIMAEQMKAIKAQQSELKTLTSEYNTAAHTFQALEQIKTDKAAIDVKRAGLQVKVTQASDLTNRIKVGQETVDKLNQENITVTQQHTETMQQLEALPQADEKIIKQYQTHIQALQAKETETADIQRQYNEYIGSLTTQQVKLQQLKDTVVQLDADNKNTATDMWYYKICAEAYSKNGIPALIIDNMFPVMEENANAILNVIDNKHKIELSSLKNKITGGTKESLDIWVYNLVKNTKRLYETYSGGESTFLNLAIRKALSDLLAKRKYKRLPFLYLDEVFAMLDPKNRESVVRVINMLKKEFEQIFVISHTELRAAFPDIIKAVKINEDTSYVQ